MDDPVRVVIIDDSALMRRMIAGMLSRDPDIQVVGEARDGHEGIRLVETLRPDVVTMDVYMPNLDGLATTEHLMAYCPTPILVLTASLSSSEVDITFQMLGAGALEVVEKPSSAEPGAIERATRDLIRRIKVLARVKVVTHLRGRRRLTEEQHEARRNARSQSQREPAGRDGPARRGTQPAQPGAVVSPAIEPPHTSLLSTPPDFPLIVIGASTGGPRIVHRILADLPRDLPAAVLVVQHIAEGFSSGMVEWLQSASALPVALAVQDQAFRPGHVLVVPDQRDLLITAQCQVHLTQAPLLIQRPSIDVAMQAAAEIFATRAIGVLLTGMGRDGAFGMLAIQRRGGYTIAQDEQSSTIFGMPRAAIQLGAAIEVLSPQQISPRLVALAQQRSSGQLSGRGGAR